MRKLHFASLCLLGTVAAMPSLATTINYATGVNSGTTWVAGLSGSPSSEFSFGAGGPWNTSTGYVDGSYTFTGPDNGGYLLQDVALNGYGLLGATDGNGGILIDLPGSGVTAMYLLAEAVNSSNQLSKNDNLTITLYSGSNAVSSDNFSGGTIGFNSSAMITSVLLSPTVSNDGVFLTDFYTGTSALPLDNPGGGGGTQNNPSQTPEAATLALVGGGILITFGAKRKFAAKLAF